MKRDEAHELIEIKTDSKPLSDSEKRKIYRQIHEAARNGNWDPKAFSEEIPYSTKITNGNETALHIAVAANQVNYVKQLVKMMSYEDLTTRDVAGNTAFCVAAASGNVEMAKVMMKEDDGRNACLAMTRGRNNELPLYKAASQGRTNMAHYLYELTKELLEKEYYDKIDIFTMLIQAGIYDVALSMIKEDRKLGLARNRCQETALHVLAQKPSLPKHPGIWHRCILFCMSPFPLKIHSLHEEATELVKWIWNEMLKKNDEEIAELIKTPWRLIFVAAEKGNVEFLRILIPAYPNLMKEVDENGHSIIHIAVKHRQEEIFRLIHELGSIKDVITSFKDNECNNMLHLAAKMPSTPSRLLVVPGAALQLQRELLWFEHVKKVVHVLPLLEAKNKDDKTPEVLFMNSHEILINPGEEWMRGFADKCMLVATLIATVVFAAAFAVPGGYKQDDGTPVFLGNIGFIVFAVSDALSFLSSIASVLSFLGIMTSRYQLHDFYWSLPHKLIIGLATLFVSVVAMLVAFATTLLLVLNHGNGSKTKKQHGKQHDNGLIWVAIPIAVAACVPVGVFIWMHLSLFKDMIKQTYMSKTIFKADEPLFLVPRVAVNKSD